MKLKKVVSLCNQSGRFELLDEIGKHDKVTQWLGDGNAIYPIPDLPVLDTDDICTIFEVSAKKREEFFFEQREMPESINVSDDDVSDRMLRDYGFRITLDGDEIIPLESPGGLICIQSQYLSPLRDVIDLTTLYERTMPDGRTMVVAKTGLLIAAVIYPVDAIKAKFLTQFEKFTQECRLELERRAKAERDGEQDSLFERES